MSKITSLAQFKVFRTLRLQKNILKKLEFFEEIEFHIGRQKNIPKKTKLEAAEILKKFHQDLEDFETRPFESLQIFLNEIEAAIQQFIILLV